MLGIIDANMPGPDGVVPGPIPEQPSGLATQPSRFLYSLLVPPLTVGMSFLFGGSWLVKHPTDIVQAINVTRYTHCNAAFIPAVIGGATIFGAVGWLFGGWSWAKKLGVAGAAVTFVTGRAACIHPY